MLIVNVHVLRDEREQREMRDENRRVRRRRAPPVGRGVRVVCGDADPCVGAVYRLKCQENTIRLKLPRTLHSLAHGGKQPSAHRIKGEV